MARTKTDGFFGYLNDGTLTNALYEWAQEDDAFYMDGMVRSFGAGVRYWMKYLRRLSPREQLRWGKDWLRLIDGLGSEDRSEYKHVLKLHSPGGPARFQVENQRRADLRNKLIRLAYEQPALRAELLPLVKEAHTVLEWRGAVQDVMTSAARVARLLKGHSGVVRVKQWPERKGLRQISFWLAPGSGPHGRRMDGEDAEAVAHDVLTRSGFKARRYAFPGGAVSTKAWVTPEVHVQWNDFKPKGANEWVLDMRRNFEMVPRS